MEKFYGECVGGPLNEKWLVHWSKSYPLLRPMMACTFPFSERAPIIPVTIGEYKLNDYQQWHWWPTKEGQAMETLLGPPQS